MRASSSFSFSFLPGWYRAGPELDFLARCLVSDTGLEEGGASPLPLAAVLLEGPPGTGKTLFASALAEAWGASLVGFAAHEWVSDETFVLSLDPAQVGAMAGGLIAPDAARAYRLGVLAEAALFSRLRDRLVLLLDELDKAPPPADALLLEFLNSGRVRVPAAGAGALEARLREAGLSAPPPWIWREGAFLVVAADRRRLIVVATSNRRRELSDELLRRFRVVEAGFLPSRAEAEIIAEEARVPLAMALAIARLLARMRGAPGCSFPSVPQGVRLARDLLRARTFEEARAAVLWNLARVDADREWLREEGAGLVSALWGEMRRALASAPSPNGHGEASP
jgi:MoxR-like ATPase